MSAITASQAAATTSSPASASAAAVESLPMMPSKQSNVVEKASSSSTGCGAASDGDASAAAGSTGESGAAEEAAVTLTNALAAIRRTVDTASTPAQHQQLFTQVLDALTSSLGAQAGVHDQLFKQTFTSRLAYSQPTSWDEFHALVVQKWGARDQGKQPNKSLLEIRNRLAVLTSGKYMPRPRRVALATEVLAYLATLLAWKQGSAAE